MRGHGAVLHLSQTRLPLDNVCVKATQKLTYLVSKGSAACHSVLGASGLKKNVTWELVFYYYSSQSGLAGC